MKAWEIPSEEDSLNNWLVAAETPHDACLEALRILGWVVSAEPLDGKFVCAVCGIVCDSADHLRADIELCDICYEKQLEIPADPEVDDGWKDENAGQ